MAHHAQQKVDVTKKLFVELHDTSDGYEFGARVLDVTTGGGGAIQRLIPSADVRGCPHNITWCRHKSAKLHGA